MQFVDIFRGILNCIVGDGKSCLFWEDLWNNKIRSAAFPRIFSFARNGKISVHMFSQRDLSQLFVLPLSKQAFQEYLLMSSSDPLSHLNGDRDLWTYVWGNGIFSSQKIYAMNFMHIQIPNSINWIWKSKCAMKIKVFGWLLLIDRLNTYGWTGVIVHPIMLL